MLLENYAHGKWIKDSGKQSDLTDASTGELIAPTSTSGLDFGAMLTHSRKVGGPTLRTMC